MAGPLDGRCILVVEDEAVVALMVAQPATEAGATVIGPIADASTALALVEAEAVDCAILDYKLAGIAPRFASVPCVEKIYLLERLLQMIVAVCNRANLSPRNSRSA
jgi:CheY-like chemotaxis protein